MNSLRDVVTSCEIASKNISITPDQPIRPFMRITAIAILLICAESSIAMDEFVHPGVAHSHKKITFTKKKIEAGEQPWLNAWKGLKGTRYASLDYKPQPMPHVERGAYNDPDVGSSEFSDDGRAAYYHAICWALSDEQAHAAKAVDIINAWSKTLKSISNHDAKLLIGMSGYHYCIAAELLKHTAGNWPTDEQARFEKMLREIWYPVIKDFYPTANGNWDASMLQVMIAMGVFLDDREMFDRAKDYFLSGRGNGTIGNYFLETGQCPESGRDQAHTQMGLEFLANTCETAWIQNVDLYAALDNRLLRGFEYTAMYNLGMDVPYEPYRSVEGRYHYKKISNNSRGRLRPMYERVLNHYQTRKGLEAPFTEKAAFKLRNNQLDDRGDQNQRSRDGRIRNGRSRNGRDGQRRRGRSTSSYLDTLMYASQRATASAVE